MTVYAEILFKDGTRRVEALTVAHETSHYRIQQKVTADHPNIEKVSIFEDKWHIGDKRNQPTETHRAIAFMTATGKCEVILHGWTPSDVEAILKQKLFWTYIDIPSQPAELEGKTD